MDDRELAEACTGVAATEDVEAWGIAVDLIGDLGAADAVAWASEYMYNLEEDDRPGAAARWRIVTDALAELTRARLH